MDCRSMVFFLLFARRPRGFLTGSVIAMQPTRGARDVTNEYFIGAPAKAKV